MIELTVLAKRGGPLTKRITLDADGSLVSDGGGCVMATGSARRFEFDDFGHLAELIERLTSYEALALGALRSDVVAPVNVVTKRKLNGTLRLNLIARTSDYLVYRKNKPALALIDFDAKGMPPEVRVRIDELGGVWAALTSIAPPLNGTAHLIRSSTSGGLYRTDTGAKIQGSGGLHLYLSVKDGTDIERFLKTLHARCWLAGLGWMMVGAGGQLLERSIVDRLVGAPERLVFEGPPMLEPPLAQSCEARQCRVFAGEASDTVAACPPLTLLELALLGQLRVKEAHRLARDMTKARQAFLVRQSQRIAERTGMSPQRARTIIERQCEGILLPDVELPFDEKELAGSTVADVLADPARFEDATLADPLEGVEYGRGKAKILRRADGTPWINSFAHGHTVYELRFDYRAAKAVMEKTAADEADDLFVRYALSGDLDHSEIERLRNLASARSGTTKTALSRRLDKAKTAAAKREKEQERQRRLAEREDSRPLVLAPKADAPWLPQMELLNAVLGTSPEPEPPMRDIDGVITRVRVRRIPNMHALTVLGANEEEPVDMRLPPPEQPLLTKLSEAQLAEMIECYVDYVDDTGRSVHLNKEFVRHFHTRDDNKLPLAVAISTLPIVLGDGTLLMGPGLDRKYGIVFHVQPELSVILPNKEECTASAVADAMRFLTDDWLCDVACDYQGKCILVAAALTIIERSLLPDRPTFWVIAGRRGGGKTTTLIMLMMAVTGIRPAAAAWSPNEEERRKALLAYFLEGLPAIIWDNIPKGSQISCPHIEKSCTATFYSDRKLGVSETIATSAATIQFFTGNNIGPRGDLSSRSLGMRLAIDRPDPENRKFRHDDPIGWTEVHRGRILRALYTILLGNPRFHSGPHVRPQTRFKTWWSLIGRAVEFAAKQHKDHFAAFVTDPHLTCPPVAISFRDLFLAQEEDDEESTSLADVLTILAEKWPDRAPFQAADVATLANGTGGLANEREVATTLREFLYPGISPSIAVTAKGTGKRLKRHIDNPVSHHGGTLILKGGSDTHTKISWFYVDSRTNAD